MTTPTTMTYAAARQAMRHFYDQWDAARTLHSVLEKAAEAETFLGRTQPLMQAAEDKLATLDAQYKEKVALYQTKLAEMEATLAEHQRQAQERMEQLEREYAVARQTHEASQASLARDLVRAQDDHAATLKILHAEAVSARERAAEARAELENARGQFSRLFG